MDRQNGKGRALHAYIIASPSEEVRDRLAGRLAASVVCSGAGTEPCGDCRDCRKAVSGMHPDIITVERATDDKGEPRREIYVEQIRRMVADAYILPNEAERKAYVVRDAGFMNSGAQNAMLKILEEPPGHAAFILCVENEGLLLDTVRSRCVKTDVNAEGGDRDAEADASAARYLELAAKEDRAGLLRFCASAEKMQHARAVDFTLCAERLIADILCARAPDMGLDRESLVRIWRLVKRSRDYLSRNVSARHVFGMLAVRTLELK